MTTNTIRHVSDESVYKIFKPAGTAFPSNITNVQAALAALNPIAINGIPNATQTVVGISRFASQAEVDSGTLNNVSVSPATLKSAILRPPATTTVAGLTRYATTSEALAGTVGDAAVVPTGLKASVDAAKTQILSTQATELVMGLAKISTQAAALAGADDLTIMTPKKVALAIGKAIATVPSYSNASETNYGLVRMATAGEVQAGNVGNAVAISPANLKTLISTTSRNGLISIASGAEVAAGTNNTKAITPAALLSRTGNESRTGLLKTTRTVGSGDGSTALAYNANVISTQGNQSINGGLTLTGLQINGQANITSNTVIGGNLTVSGGITSRGQQVVTIDMIGDDVPVGVIVMWIGAANKVPAKWRICDGGYTYSASSNPALWNVLPTGRVPDMRGLFVRGAGVGADILNARSPDSKGKPGLGVGCGAGAVGTVQAQAVKKHKHNSGWGEHNRKSDAYFGSTMINGKRGSNRTDSDNWLYFTNDGEETEPENIRDSFGTMNPKDLMQDENRPWNIAVYYIIKIQ
jgi:hypothetical protein